MSASVLITAGAGFIGSHLANELARHGYYVRIVDSCSSPPNGYVHAHTVSLSTDIEMIEGDVRDPTVMQRALRGVDMVCHLAAMVGIGHHPYEIAKHTEANSVATAVLMEALVKHPVQRLVFPSSMSLYGEGLYRTRGGRLVQGKLRSQKQLDWGNWELCDESGAPLIPVATPETLSPILGSVHALSQYDQERFCLMMAQVYGIPAVALRLFHVYGPRVAASQPGVDVLTTFTACYLNDQPPLILEDGQQLRDFVSVHDVAQAFRLALETPAAVGHIFNIGSGQSTTINEVAALLALMTGKTHIQPIVSGQYRQGDVRHCFADISLARTILGYSPCVPLAAGLSEFVASLQTYAPCPPPLHTLFQLAPALAVA